MFKKDIHYSQWLETEVLGACLLEQSAFSRVFTLIETQTFYFDGHKVIFDVLKEMFDLNYPITIVSVFDFMIRVKKIEMVNKEETAYYLTKITEKVVNTAQVEYYAVILKKMWIDREIILLTSGGVKSDDSRKEIYSLQQKLNELSSVNFTSDWKDMDELMVDLYKHQDLMLETGGKGLLTGFKTIDTVYGGFFKGQMIVIGARPSVGKSAFAGQIAVNMARNGNRVGFISLEMSNNEIAARFASLDTNMGFSEIFRGLYADENQRNDFFRRVGESTSNLPISVSDKTEVNIAEIKAKAYKLKHQKGRLDCLIIDYLQLVDGDSQANRNRENEVAKISRGCKIIAKEMDLPLIILCQLNREVDKRSRANRHPQLSDFRESGAIEQDADVAMFLHSDFKSGFLEDESGNSTEGQADIVIRKWRNGEANKIIPLEFDGPRMRFKERGYWKMIEPVKSFHDTEKDEF